MHNLLGNVIDDKLNDMSSAEGANEIIRMEFKTMKLDKMTKQDVCGKYDIRCAFEDKMEEIETCIKNVDEEYSSKIRETVKLEEVVRRLSDELQEKENTIKQEKINWNKYKNNIDQQLKIMVSQMTQVISIYRNKALILNSQKECDKCSKNEYTTVAVDEKSDTNLQQRYFKLRDLAKKMKMKIDDLTNELTKERERTAQLTNQAMRSQNLQLECDKLSDCLDSKTREMKQIQKELMDHVQVRHRLTKQLNELTAVVATHKTVTQSMHDQKQSLESQVKSLSGQLDACKKEVSALQVVRKEQDKTICQLRGSLKECEKNNNKLVQEISELNAQVDQLRQLKLESSNYHDEICILKGCIENVEQVSEKRRNELAEALDKWQEEKSSVQRLTLEMCDLLRNYEDMKKEYELKMKMETAKINELSLEVDLYKEKCDSQKREMQIMQEEFNQYKVKAHDILQKHDDDGNWKEQRKQMQCNMEQLQDTVTTLNQKLNNTRCQLESKIVDMEILQTTNEQLEGQIKSMQQQVSQLEDKVHEMTQNHKSYKSNMEQLVASYKTEIDCKIMLEKDIVDLKKQLERNDNELISEVTPLSSISSDQLEKQQDKVSNCCYNENRVRRVSSSSSCVNKQAMSCVPIPLDQLLSNEKQPLFLDGDLDVVEEDVVDLKHQLRMDKIRIKHLRELVDEAEYNASRNEVQLSFLKEEVRRLQRSFERQTHLENSEYFKNIIFKFLVLQNAEERTRLVPVIETMLKLSPIETKQLNLLAKGCSSNTDGSSWSSLLSWR